MEKLNCWEYKRCGMELGRGGSPQDPLCPATTNTSLEGVHGGISAGRACWVVSGTFCNDSRQGQFRDKSQNCGKCAFYELVREEEAEEFIPTVTLLKWLHEEKTER